METPLLQSSTPLETALDIDKEHSKKHDVFLNFTSEETGKNIVGNLRTALSEEGFEAFVNSDDDNQTQSIEDSSCAVVILSPSYARSSRCLDELVKILDCARRRGQILIPVLCHVDSSLVRKQVRSFSEGFTEDVETPLMEESLERVHGWRVAVTEVCNLAGFDLKNYKDEAHFVKEIVAEVSLRLKNVASAKIPKDERSCMGKLLSPNGYGLTTFVGAIGGLLLFFLIVFPLFG